MGFEVAGKNDEGSNVSDALGKAVFWFRCICCKILLFLHRVFELMFDGGITSNLRTPEAGPCMADVMRDGEVATWCPVA